MSDSWPRIAELFAFRIATMCRATAGNAARWDLICWTFRMGFWYWYYPLLPVAMPSDLLKQTFEKIKKSVYLALNTKFFILFQRFVPSSHLA